MNEYIKVENLRIGDNLLVWDSFHVITDIQPQRRSDDLNANSLFFADFPPISAFLGDMYTIKKRQMDEKRKQRMVLLMYARSLGYKLRRVNQWNYVLEQVTTTNGKIVFNLYWSKKYYLFSVVTAMDHPTKKKTQLSRKFLNVDDVKKLLDNPRLHTGKGYYKKTK